jgi:hypothetical protein
VVGVWGSGFQWWLISMHPWVMLDVPFLQVEL